MPDILTALLAARDCLVADGAMGTNLFAAGLMTGDAPELWSLDHADRIAAVHRGMVEAGADIILTNSFGANRYRLALHGAEGRVAELNRAAARIAREVADAAGRPVVVAGSMGPTGEIYQPVGPSPTAAKPSSNRRRRWPRAAPTCCGSRPSPAPRSSRPRSAGPRSPACPSSPP